MKYQQLSLEERSTLAALRGGGYGVVEIAKVLGRHRVTIWREVERNRAAHDGRYRAERAQEHAVARRRRSRRNGRIEPGQWKRVEGLLGEEQRNPEQIAGYFRETGEMKISHESIYRHVWRDRERDGRLWEHLRGARKQRRKRYGRQDSRGRLAGKRAIGERPQVVEERRRVGDWEIDTVHGSGKAWVGNGGGAQKRLCADREAGGLHGGADQWADAVVDETASWEVPDDHRGQRDGVPRVCGTGETERSEVLLCDAASCVGAREQ